MYVGSSGPLNREYLKRLKELVRRTKTPWLTYHLCWGSVDGWHSHDFLPMPYTFEAANLAARKMVATIFGAGPFSADSWIDWRSRAKDTSGHALGRAD